MNRGNLHQSSPVQQLMAAGGPNWWNIKNNIMMRPSPPPPPPNNNIFPQNAPPPPSFSWHHDNQELPESWRQLLMGGRVAEEDKSSSSSGLSHIHVQAKKLEIWEDQVDHVKQETSAPNISYDHHHHLYGNINNNAELIQAEAANPTWSHQMMPVSSPKSCVTSLSSSNMLNFSNSKSDGRHPPPDRSFEVRKEKLGDRITALHQIVSPFGKTDTASVLFEVIGYIKFLQNQIEALCLPYLGNGSGYNTRQQQQSESIEEAEKELRSKGLCLVPVSLTLLFGSETNGADYWAPPAI